MWFTKSNITVVKQSAQLGQLLTIDHNIAFKTSPNFPGEKGHKSGHLFVAANLLMTAGNCPDRKPVTGIVGSFSRSLMKKIMTDHMISFCCWIDYN